MPADCARFDAGGEEEAGRLSANSTLGPDAVDRGAGGTLLANVSTLGPAPRAGADENGRAASTLGLDGGGAATDVAIPEGAARTSAMSVSRADARSGTPARAGVGPEAEGKTVSGDWSTAGNVDGGSSTEPTSGSRATSRTVAEISARRVSDVSGAGSNLGAERGATPKPGDAEADTPDRIGADDEAAVASGMGTAAAAIPVRTSGDAIGAGTGVGVGAGAVSTRGVEIIAGGGVGVGVATDVNAGAGADVAARTGSADGAAGRTTGTAAALGRGVAAAIRTSGARDVVGAAS